MPEWVVRSLAENGIHRLSELSSMTDRDLLKLKGVGRRSVEMLRAELEKRPQRPARGAKSPPEAKPA